MGILYLMSEGTKVSKDGPRLSVERDGKLVGRMPLRMVDGVVIGCHAHVTTPVIFTLLEQKIPIIYADDRGNPIGHIQNTTQSPQRLFRQLDMFRDEATSLELSKEVVAEKIGNQFNLLKQYGKTKKSDELNALAQVVKRQSDQALGAETLDELRGIEGMASRVYFNAFGLILDQGQWEWKARSRKPGKDPVNALLNYGYAFLEREVRVAALVCGLDVRIGFLHANDGRKDSLVFDLMELFRQPVTDRLVLSLFNLKVMKQDDFERSKDDCRLTDEGRLMWCTRYEEYMLREYKEYGGKTSRDMILDRVRRFATHIDRRK